MTPWERAEKVLKGGPSEDDVVLEVRIAKAILEAQREATARERERCAKVAESWPHQALAIGEAIRRLGEDKPQ